MKTINGGNKMTTNIKFDSRSLKAKNLLEKFKDYTKEEILDAISRLREDQRELVFNAYGPNLDNPLLRIYLPIEERRRVDSIVHNTLFRYLRINIYQAIPTASAATKKSTIKGSLSLA